MIDNMINRKEKYSHQKGAYNRQPVFSSKTAEIDLSDLDFDKY